MRRLPLIVLLSAAALAAVPAAAFAQSGPAAAASLEACATSPAPLERSLTVRGEMEATPHSDRLAMRFDLFVRRPGDTRFHRVDGPGLDEWITSGSGVARFIYRKQVVNLEAPAEYRARVLFHWHDRDGDVIARERRVTAVCRQPDQRPDLAPEAPTAAPASAPGLVRYSVPVRNDGRGDAGAFDVVLTVGAGALAPVTVPELAAGTTQAVTFLAPPCAAGDRLTVQVDPEDRVEEADDHRADNRLTVDCPLR